MEFLQTDTEKFDIILLDAPCSATGTFRRHPEVIFIKTKEDVQQQSYLQKQLLDKCINSLKIGGTLVYSTCTITGEENKENAEWIEKNLPFEKKIIADLLPEALKSSCERNMIQLLPGIHPCDGFFISAFRKKK